MSPLTSLRLTSRALSATDSAETPGAPRASRSRVSLKALGLLVCVALLVYVADQLSKAWVVANLDERTVNPVLGELLQFVFVRNPGAAFSLASGSTWIFSIAASLVTLFIILFAHRIRSIGWAVLFGMLLGGTLGNLTDRLFREPGFGVGHVIDFIQVWGFPAIFNIADIFIVSSMGLFIILTLKGIGMDGTRQTTEPKSDGSVGTAINDEAR
ncbi:signal peptidase II [Salinibacterium hongtaonis]|uniref:signal peptidase II n=1 Tax=Homoserinimonas hongtaonis TaxID=2079791 RepID=UPI0038CD874F